ncbi:MAG: hypothetical protein EOM23_01240 [Candidatus Moranbacteria bacterium]|nr:hypothetical protein [Candidatus Moranbacteria bacterium]
MKKMLRFSLCFILIFTVMVLAKLPTVVYAAEITTTEPSITTTAELPTFDEDEIQAVLVEFFEENFAWLLTALGISATALVGIIFGLYKAVLWLKRKYIQDSIILKSTESSKDESANLSKALLAFTAEIEEFNKLKPILLYNAKATDLIVQASKNDTLVANAEKLHTEYIKAVDAQNLTAKQSKQIAKELASSAAEIIEKVESKGSEILTYAEKIKQNLTQTGV